MHISMRGIFRSPTVIYLGVIVNIFLRKQKGCCCKNNKGYSKAKFLKRVPECVKNEEKEHVDIWDGMEVLFLKGDKAGYLPLYHYPGEAY